MAPINCFKVPHDTSLRPMEIGDFVTYRGRSYVLRGLDPMSVDGRRAHLEDASTGDRRWVALEEIEEGTPEQEA